ncbi:MAG: hypothetical protein IIC75_06815 [Bacteroidetes bacterium]|nr:hypothetical protein [Bacteroidota bacterium]
MIRKTFFILTFAFVFAGCGVVKEITNLSRLQFRLANIESITLGGLTFTDKTSIKDLSSLDVLKLSTSFIRGEMLLKFVVNVEVKNPNAENTASSKYDFKISSFPWRLLLNGREAIAGNIFSPINIPGDKEISYIPVSIKFNLIKFIRDKKYESIIDLVFNLTRQKNTLTQLEFYAKPVIDTPFGNIDYPGELKIISLNYTN